MQYKQATSSVTQSFIYSLPFLCCCSTLR